MMKTLSEIHFPSPLSKKLQACSRMRWFFAASLVALAGNAVAADEVAMPAADPVEAVVGEVVLSEAPVAASLANRLRLASGDRLSQKLEEWLTSKGYELQWEAEGTLQGRFRDVVIQGQWRSTGEDVASVLTELLPEFGFSAEILKHEVGGGQVVVRNISSVVAN